MNNCNSEKNNSFFICDSCGSNQVRADYQGLFVCHNCGLCHDEPYINQFSQSIIKDRQGNISHQSSVMFGTGTIIGNKKERSSKLIKKLSYVQNVINISPKDKAYSQFKRLKAEFDIELDLNNFIIIFSKLFHRLPLGTKARNIRNLSTTLFIIICRKYGLELNLKSVLNFTQLSLKDYYAILRPIYQIIPKIGQISVKVLQDSAIRIISRLSDEFGASFETFQLARKLILNHRKYLGEKIRIVAGSALVIADTFLNQKLNLSVFEIAKILGVSSSTIYARKNEFPFKKLETYLNEHQETKSEVNIRHNQNLILNNAQICRNTENIRPLVKIKSKLNKYKELLKYFPTYQEYFSKEFVMNNYSKENCNFLRFKEEIPKYNNNFNDTLINQVSDKIRLISYKFLQRRKYYWLFYKNSKIYPPPPKKGTSIQNQV